VIGKREVARQTLTVVAEEERRDSAKKSLKRKTGGTGTKEWEEPLKLPGKRNE